MLRHVMMSCFRHALTCDSDKFGWFEGPVISLFSDRVVQSAALCCPLATDSSTKTGPDGGDGGAKQEGRSLDVLLG